MRSFLSMARGREIPVSVGREGDEAALVFLGEAAPHARSVPPVLHFDARRAGDRLHLSGPGGMVLAVDASAEDDLRQAARVGVMAVSKAGVETAETEVTIDWA